jgi:hypothetical protein
VVKRPNKSTGLQAKLCVMGYNKSSKGEAKARKRKGESSYGRTWPYQVEVKDSALSARCG